MNDEYARAIMRVRRNSASRHCEKTEISQVNMSDIYWLSQIRMPGNE